MSLSLLLDHSSYFANTSLYSRPYRDSAPSLCPITAQPATRNSSTLLFLAWFTPSRDSSSSVGRQARWSVYKMWVVCVSALNFALLSFLNIPSCIAISRDPSRLSRDACPTLHPPLCFIPHDPHDPNNSYDLCLKINQSPGVYRDILECYPGHPNPSRSRGLILHPASLFPAACGIATTPRLQQLELPLTTAHSCRCSPVGTRPLKAS